MAKKHPLVKFSETGRFEGSVYVSATGEPVAATTGTVLVVPGAKSVDEMVWTMLGSRPACAKNATTPLPSKEAVVCVIPRNQLAWSGPVDVSLDTKPDPTLLQYATDDAARNAENAARDLPFVEQRLQQAEADLAVYLATKRRGRRGLLRENVTQCKQWLIELGREVLAVPQGIETHALVVGNAPYDLGLIFAALQALQATAGRLISTGGYSAGILTCDRGMALVMPFRTPALPEARK